MDEDNKKNRFESRVLADMIDVLAVVNHLEDNLGNDRPLQVILTIDPRRASEIDCCSVEGTNIKTIRIENEKGILDVGKFLTEKLFTANIHVTIE